MSLQEHDWDESFSAAFTTWRYISPLGTRIIDGEYLRKQKETWSGVQVACQRHLRGQSRAQNVRFSGSGQTLLAPMDLGPSTLPPNQDKPDPDAAFCIPLPRPLATPREHINTTEIRAVEQAVVHALKNQTIRGGSMHVLQR